MLKKRVVAAVAAALMAGGASAVGVNPGGKGEQLVAPMLMVAGGYEAEIRLVNTDTVNSTVVKLTFHERQYSEEVLDFLVFLSPGDVWRGTAKAMPHVTSGMNRLGITSTDDSALYVSSSGNRCPVATATSVGFDPTKVISAETRQAGNGFAAGATMDSSFTYLTVLESTTITGLGAAPVDKAKILAAYSAACNTGAVTTHSNAIAGDVTLRNPASGTVMNLPMLALDNVNATVFHKVGSYSQLGNSSTKQTVEDALWANDFAVPFSLENGSQTYATVTFPTKDTWFAGGVTGSQYFSRVGINPSVSLVARNEKEETIANVGCFVSPCAQIPGNQMPWELNVLAFSQAAGASNAGVVTTSGFGRGWVQMNLEAVPSVAIAASNYKNTGVTGAPAIATVMTWEPRAAGGFNGTWAYAAKTQLPK